MADIRRQDAEALHSFAVDQRFSEEKQENQAIDITKTLLILWRRKYLVLATALLVLIPAAVGSFMATPNYQSTSVLQLDPNPARVLPFTDLPDSPPLADYELFVKTQDQILRSVMLVSRVAEELEEEGSWSEELVGEFVGSGVGIERVAGSQLLSLSYASPDPYFAAKVVNLYAEEFIRLRFENRQEIVEKAKAFLEERLAFLKDKIELSEQELVEYARDKDLLSLDNQKTDHDPPDI